MLEVNAKSVEVQIQWIQSIPVTFRQKLHAFHGAVCKKNLHKLLDKNININVQCTQIPKIGV